MSETTLFIAAICLLLFVCALPDQPMMPRDDKEQDNADD